MFFVQKKKTGTPYLKLTVIQETSSASTQTDACLQLYRSGHSSALQRTLITLTVSEAKCETLGSKMEHYHRTGFMTMIPYSNTTTVNRRLLKTIALQGPPNSASSSLIVRMEH